jgi:hypothetical protein
MRKGTPVSPMRGDGSDEEESYGEGSFESFSSPHKSPKKSSAQNPTRPRSGSDGSGSAEDDGAHDQSNDSQGVAGMDLETFMGNYKVRMMFNDTVTLTQIGSTSYTHISFTFCYHSNTNSSNCIPSLVHSCPPRCAVCVLFTT